MIDEFIARTFADRDMAHIAHFASRSYAEHMALGAFYEAIPGAVDTVVEAYQGMFGLVGGKAQIDVREFSVDALQESADWIEVNRKEIAGDSDAVANLVDAVTAIYLSAIYKLRNLS